jgi:hypothetical protein
VCKKGKDGPVWGCDYSAVKDYSPIELTCDGVDNDCDGTPDDQETFPTVDVAAACAGKAKGVCLGGTPDGVRCVKAPGGDYDFACTYKNVGDFVVEEFFGADSEDQALYCDGLDNDCDGETDELLAYEPNGEEPLTYGPCVEFKGPCEVTVLLGTLGIYDGEVAFRCNEGSLECAYANLSAFETKEASCDGEDNDCDGEVDVIRDWGPSPCPLKGVCADHLEDGLVKAACVEGEWLCDTSGLWGTPEYELQERSCDGLDNDCDGATDEGLGWMDLAFPEICDNETDDDKNGLADCKEPLCKAFHPFCNGKTPVFEDCPLLKDVTVAGKKGKVPVLGSDGFPLGHGVCAPNPATGRSPVLFDCSTKDVDGNGTKETPYFRCSYDGIEAHAAVEKYEAGEGQALCDGRDNDCDGKTDEDLRVTDTGLSGTTCRYLGACAGNTTATCNADTNNDGQGDAPGQWACAYNTVTPNAEWGSCDPASPHCFWTEQSCDGLDNDCDGSTDEGLDGLGTQVSTACAERLNKGVCKADKLNTACGHAGGGKKGFVCDYTGVYEDGYATREDQNPRLCDGLDNDCDGATDEGISTQDPKIISSSGCLYKGVCNALTTAKCNADSKTPGVWACDYSTVPAFQAFTDPKLGPREYLCDGFDNDCDGLVDEDLDKDFGAAAGILNPKLASACKTVGVCEGSARWGCKPGTIPSWFCDYASVTGFQATEASCDKKDNDCDGQTDENLSDAGPTGGNCAGYGKGVCTGVLAATCGSEGWQCLHNQVPDYEATEKSCDGLDNDCDGTTDVSLNALDSPGKNACRIAGVCAEGGLTGSCDGLAGWNCNYSGVADFEPLETLCDGLDNDCNGSADLRICKACQPCTQANDCETNRCHNDPTGQMKFCATAATSCVFLEGTVAVDGTTTYQCKQLGSSSAGCMDEVTRITCQSGAWDVNQTKCAGDLPVCYNGVCQTCMPGRMYCYNNMRMRCNQKTLTSADWAEGGLCLDPEICFGSGKCVATNELTVSAASAGTSDFLPRPKVAISSNNFTMVVWATNDSTADGAEGAVLGRVYNDSFEALSAPFVVNSSATGIQDRPQVAPIPVKNGGFAVVYQSRGLADDEGVGVAGRFFDQKGVPIGAEFSIPGNRAGDQLEPVVSCHTDGNCFAAWHGLGTLDPNNTGVYGRFFKLGLGPVGNELLLNTTTADAQRSPAVDFLSDGKLIAAWSSNGQDSEGTAVIAQFFEASGTKNGGELVLNKYTSQSQKAPALAAMPFDPLLGGFAAVWESTLQDGSSVGVYGNAFRSSGVRYIGSNDVKIPEKTINAQQAPAVGVLENDDMIFVWESQSADSEGYGIAGLVYLVAGYAGSTEYRLNVNQAGDQRSPDVAVAQDHGPYVVVWSDQSSGSQIKLRPFRY